MTVFRGTTSSLASLSTHLLGRRGPPAAADAPARSLLARHALAPTRTSAAAGVAAWSPLIKQAVWTQCELVSSSYHQFQYFRTSHVGVTSGHTSTSQRTQIHRTTHGHSPPRPSSSRACLPPLSRRCAQPWKPNELGHESRARGRQREQSVTRAARHSAPLPHSQTIMCTSACAVLRCLGLRIPGTRSFAQPSRMRPRTSNCKSA